MQYSSAPFLPSYIHLKISSYVWLTVKGPGPDNASLRKYTGLSYRKFCPIMRIQKFAITKESGRSVVAAKFGMICVPYSMFPTARQQ